MPTRQHALKEATRSLQLWETAGLPVHPRRPCRRRRRGLAASQGLVGSQAHDLVVDPSSKRHGHRCTRIPVYTSVCAYTQTCINMCICTYIHTCIYQFIPTYLYIDLYLSKNLCRYLHRDTQVDTHVYMHVHKCIPIRHVHLEGPASAYPLFSSSF